MKLSNILFRVPRSILWRIQMRLQHVLDHWAPQQHLFAQVDLLDRRTDLIEHRIVNLANRFEQQAEHTNRQMAAISDTLARLQSGSGSVSREDLQMQLAPLEARMVRLGLNLSADRDVHLDSLTRVQDEVANLNKGIPTIGARFDSVGVRLDDLAEALQASGQGVGARFDSVGIRFDDLAGALQASGQGVGARFNSVGERLDDLAGALQTVGTRLDNLSIPLRALPAFEARFDSVGVRFDDLAAVLQQAREESGQIGLGANRQIDGIKIRFDGMDRRFDDIGAHLGGVEGRVEGALHEVRQLTSKALSRQHIPLADGYDATRTPKGWIVVPREEYRSLIHLAEGSAYHEPGTLHVVETLLNPGDIAVDVGAHIGLITVPMAFRVGPQGRVVSLEPLPRNAEALLRSVALNGLSERVTIHINAAADVTKETPLFMGVTGMMASLYPDDPNQSSVMINTVRLDDVIAPGGRVDMVKIDAEGAELAVLHGMERIIADNDRLLLIAELGPSHLVRTNNDIQSWISAFEALGFAGAFEIDDAKLALRPLRNIKQLKSIYSVNVLFTKQANDPRLSMLLAQGRPPRSKAGQ